MIVLGIDPGIAGALAVLDGNDLVFVVDLPVHKVGRAGTKALRSELDLHSLHGLLAEHGPYAHAFIEKVGPMPKQGVTSTFRFGFAFGAIQGLVAAMGIPMTLVPSKQWQGFHRCGPSPDSARQRAMQLHPAACSCFARKRDANRADALLIAAYGAHKLNGNSQEGGRDVIAA